MSTNKHAQIRYKTLDRCFSNKGRLYNIEDLLVECNKAISNFDFDSKGIKKRQLFEDIRFMKSDSGWGIELEEGLSKEDKKAYRYKDHTYSISNEPITEMDANLLRSALETLSRFKGLPQFDWVDELSLRLEDAFDLNSKTDNIISFEENIYLKGKELITPIYNAIYYKQSIKIEYESFKSSRKQNMIMSPYFLKQYNNRWFVFGQVADYLNLTNLALDRIEKVLDSDKVFIESQIDFGEYFEDIVGVSVTDEPLQTIRLKIDIQQWPYIKTKPLHGSQKIVLENNDSVEITIEVKPNIELENMLLQYGESIEVVAPKKFRNLMAEKIEKSYNNYFTE